MPFDISTIAQGGAAAAIAYMFLRYLTGRDKSQEIRDAAFVKALDDLSNNSKKQTKATNTMADAQVKTAKEAAQRNGHLGEQNIQITEMITSSHKELVEAIKDISVQHVDVQKVDKQTIVKTEAK